MTCLKLLLISFILLTSFVLSAEKKQQYNVLFISIDDLNDWLGCMGGHPQAKTPNIDRLAKSGTLFSKAYCQAPACLPSRASAMTGIAPWTSGCYENQHNQQWQHILKPIADTIPGYFRKNGYFTAGSGKVFHHFQNDPDSWDDYYPSKRIQFPLIHNPKKKDLTIFKGKTGVPDYWYGEFKWGPLDMDERLTGDNHAVQYVIDQMNAHKSDKPFFLSCGIYRPHVPWFAPKKYFDMFPLEDIKLPPRLATDFDDIPLKAKVGTYYKVLTKYKQHKQAVQAYLACVAYMDALIGRLMRGLEKSGHADNTIVVFWSDHGWHLGEKSRYRKFTLWEESCKVPLIIKLPKGFNSKLGQVCERVVSLLDIFPTLVNLCNLPNPKQKLDGQSLVPLLVDPSQKWDSVAITVNRRNNYSLRTEKYRYIRYQNGGEELYDHDKDPQEWTNLAKLEEYQEIKKALANRLPKTSKPYQVTPVFDWPKYRKEVLQKAKQDKIYERVKPMWD